MTSVSEDPSLLSQEFPENTAASLHSDRQVVCLCMLEISNKKTKLLHFGFILHMSNSAHGHSGPKGATSLHPVAVITTGTHLLSLTHPPASRHKRLDFCPRYSEGKFSKPPQGSPFPNAALHTPYRLVLELTHATLTHVCSLSTRWQRPQPLGCLHCFHLSRILHLFHV